MNVLAVIVSETLRSSHQRGSGALGGSRAPGLRTMMRSGSGHRRGPRSRRALSHQELVQAMALLDDLGRTGSAPPFVLEESLDALSNLVANLPDSIERFALGILERPVVALETGHNRTMISASHGDEHLSSFR